MVAVQPVVLGASIFKHGRGTVVVVDPREPQAFTPAEEKRLLEAAESERDRLLVEFMLRTGLRLQEVARRTARTSTPS